jgi:tetratricopeptide (TPR) repeat protein
MRATKNTPDWHNKPKAQGDRAFPIRKIILCRGEPQDSDMGSSSDYRTFPADPQGMMRNTPVPGTLRSSDFLSSVGSAEPNSSLINGHSLEDQPPLSAFGIFTTTPPLSDPQRTMQRGDELTTIQRMINDTQISTLVISGSPGAGKSTLAALLFRRTQLARQQGLRAPRHTVWLTLDSYTTLPDLIAGVLQGLHIEEPGLFLLKPDQQISTLLRALRRSQEQALVILDQFDMLTHPEINQGVAGRGALPSFLAMLQTDLGASRVILTSYQSPFENKGEDSRVRSYLVSRISVPEGVTLLQQRGVQCAPEDLSLTWQRCTGHVYSLILFSALVQLSNVPANTLLNSQHYRPLWAGDVVDNLLTGLHHYLNPVQRGLLHALSLFHTPASRDGLTTVLTGINPLQDEDISHSQIFAGFERELISLVQIGLVQPVYASDGELSYTIHSLLRQYLHEHFLEGEQQAQAQPPLPEGAPHNADPTQAALAAGHVQVASYYRQRIAEHCPPRDERNNPLDVEPIIRAVRHFCLGWRWQRACDLLFEENLHENMVQHGTWNALLGLFTALLPPLGVLLRRDEGLVAGHVALLYGRLGEHQQSKSYFEQALSAQRQVNDALGEAMTLTNQGELLRLQGDFEQARQNFTRALGLLDKRPDDQLRCILLHNQGLLAQQDHDYDRALYYFMEALQLASHLGKQQYTGAILTNMGMLLYEHDEHKEAMALLLAALRLREEAHDPSLPLLERFLVALEQKMGHEAYIQLCQEALTMQPLVFERFAPET